MVRSLPQRVMKDLSESCFSSSSLQNVSIVVRALKPIAKNAHSATLYPKSHDSGVRKMIVE